MTKHKMMKSEIEQIMIVNQVRKRFFNSMYPLSNKCKKVSWTFLFIWAIIVNIMALLYGLQFDLGFEEEANANNKNIDLFNTECWENNKKLLIENILSMSSFNALGNELEENNDYSDNYGGIESESLRWLLTCIQSFIMSIFIWQPITIYIMTWIKIWLFSWNLGFGTGPLNMLCLIKNCCCMSSGKYVFNNKSPSDNKQWVKMYSHRQLDLIGYFANDALFAKTQNPNDINIYNKHNEEEEEIKLDMELELATLDTLNTLKNNNKNNKNDKHFDDDLIDQVIQINNDENDGNSGIWDIVEDMNDD